MKKIILLYFIIFNTLGNVAFANFYTDFYKPTANFHICYYKMFENTNSAITTKDFFNSLLQNCHSNNKNDIAYTLQQCFYFDFLNKYPYYAKTNSTAIAQDLITKQALNTCVKLVKLYQTSVQNSNQNKLDEMIAYSKTMAFDFIKK